LKCEFFLVDDEVELTDPLSRLLTRDKVLMWLMMGLSQMVAQKQLRSTDSRLHAPKNRFQDLRSCNWGQITPVLFLTKDTLDDRVQGLMLVLMTIW